MTIRNGWFALLGDLSGYPYNATIVKGGTVLLNVTSPGGTLPADLQITCVASDPNGNVVAQLTVPLTALQMSVDLNAVINTTWEYSLYCYIQSASISSDIQLAWVNVAGILGANLYDPGTTVALALPAISTAGFITLLVNDASSGNPISGATFNIALWDATMLAQLEAAGAETISAQILVGSVATDSEGILTIQMDDPYIAADSLSLFAIYAGGGGSDYAVDSVASFTFSGQQLSSSTATEPISLTYSLPLASGVSAGPDTITFNFVEEDGETPYTGPTYLAIGPIQGNPTYFFQGNGAITSPYDPAWEGETVYFGWGAGANSTGANLYGSNGMDQTLAGWGVTDAAAEAGIAVVNINIVKNSGD
jgi:hypothetical protein